LIEHLGNLEQLTETLQALAERFLQNGLKDKRQKRLTTYQEIRASEAASAGQYPRYDTRFRFSTVR
jgi:hypothetical protein